MADLRTDYQDDVLDASENTARVYDLVDSDGNVVLAGVHLEDKTVYTTEGDDYGAADINTQNGKINELNADLSAENVSITWLSNSFTDEGCTATKIGKIIIVDVLASGLFLANGAQITLFSIPYTCKKGFVPLYTANTSNSCRVYNNNDNLIRVSGANYFSSNWSDSVRGQLVLIIDD